MTDILSVRHPVKIDGWEIALIVCECDSVVIVL